MGELYIAPGVAALLQQVEQAGVACTVAANLLAEATVAAVEASSAVQLLEEKVVCLQKKIAWAEKTRSVLLGGDEAAPGVEGFLQEVAQRVGNGLGKEMEVSKKAEEKAMEEAGVLLGQISNNTSADVVEQQLRFAGKQVQAGMDEGENQSRLKAAAEAAVAAAATGDYSVMLGPPRLAEAASAAGDACGLEGGVMGG